MRSGQPARRGGRRSSEGGLGGAGSSWWLRQWLLGGSQPLGLTPGRGWTILEVVTPRLPKEMSEEQLKAFWEAIQADAGLQEKLSAAKDADAVVAIAKAVGFEISVVEVAKAQAELSDEQLRDVSGGEDLCGMLMCIKMLS